MYLFCQSLSEVGRPLDFVPDCSRAAAAQRYRAERLCCWGDYVLVFCVRNHFGRHLVWTGPSWLPGSGKPSVRSHSDPCHVAATGKLGAAHTMRSEAMQCLQRKHSKQRPRQLPKTLAAFHCSLRALRHRLPWDTTPVQSSASHLPRPHCHDRQSTGCLVVPCKPHHPRFASR